MLKKHCCGLLLDLCEILICPKKQDVIKTSIQLVHGDYTVVFEHFGNYYEITIPSFDPQKPYLNIPTEGKWFDVNYCYKVYIFKDGEPYIDGSGYSGVQFCTKLLTNCQ